MLFWGQIGIMENKIETAIQGLGFRGSGFYLFMYLYK